MAQMPQDDLEPLITECPSCQTRFRVTETQLERAHGRVRCGACLTVFHGIQHLVLEGAAEAAAEAGDEEQARQALDALLDELAGESGDSDSADAAEPGESGDAPSRSAPAARFQVVSGPPEPAQERDKRAEAGGKTSLPSAPAEPSTPPPAATVVSGPAPSDPLPVVFGEPRVRRPLVWAGIVAGLLLLIAQVLWYQFDDWATEPAWRAVYAPVCAVLGCELPEQQDLGQLGTRNLVVRTHPSQPGALLVNAVIVNGADFAQPFPVLELQFTTVRGSLVAARRFAPDEYLAGDAEGMDLIPRRTPVQIELTLDDPGQEAVNYRLLFR